MVGEWKTRDSKWIPYQELAERLVSLFDEVVFVSRILVNVVVVKMEGSQRGQQAVADQGAAIGSITTTIEKMKVVGLVSQVWGEAEPTKKPA